MLLIVMLNASHTKFLTGSIRIALSPLGSSMVHGSGMVPVTYSKAVVRDRLVMVGSRDRPPPDSQTFG